MKLIATLEKDSQNATNLLKIRFCLKLSLYGPTYDRNNFLFIKQQYFLCINSKNTF